MLTASVVCVHFRLLDERLAIWFARHTSGVAGAPTWALPQRPLGDDEDEATCARALMSSLPFGRDVLRRESCCVMSAPRRVPERRELALVSWAIVRAASARVGDVPHDAGAWHTVGHASAALPELPDDHAAIVSAARDALEREILGDAVTRRLLPRHLLRSKCDDFGPASEVVARQPVLFGLLPDPFPISAIRVFYEHLLATDIDRGNFRRKIVELKPTGVLKELPLFQRGVRHRAAQLFTFDPRAWERWAATSTED